MGQTIEIIQAVRQGETALFDTDRSLGGQDGETFSTAAEAEAGATFPARLATRLFAADAAIAQVFVLSNTVSVRRAGGWDDASVEEARAVLAGFFRFY